MLLPGLASASTVWSGDFETGNLSQWDRQQVVASNRLLVQTDLVREGRYALKVTVRKGDDPINASGNRNELLYMGLEPAGSEYYYKWSTYFPASFPRSDTWQVFTQWHHEGSSGSPPLEFFIIDDEMRMRAGGVSGPIVWRAPLERGRWHDFVLRVKWSSNPKVGFVELYKDGKLAVPKRFVATQFEGDRNYLKFGLYRNDSISQEGVVYHDGFTVATTLADVMPPAPEPEPEPTPGPVAEPTPVPVPTPGPVPTPVPAPDPRPAPEPTPEPEPAPIVTPAPAPTSPTMPEPEPVATAPTPPSEEPAEPGSVVQPDDMQGPQGSLGDQPMGCGASATGGMPVLAAASLLAGLLLRRRSARDARR